MSSDADTNATPSPATEPASSGPRRSAGAGRCRGEHPKLPAAPSAQALFLDVDGTLLPIAPHPDAVRVPPPLIALLEDLNARIGGALALVSGRSLANLDRLFAPLRLPAAGVHGLERRGADGIVHTGDTASLLQPLRGPLADFAGARQGLLVEDKQHSLALHYRAAPTYDAEAEAFLRDLAAAAPGLEVTRGKMVLEVKPAGVDKGTAIVAFLAEPPFAGRHPVYIGDDVTDEDAFAAVNAAGGLSIRVGAAAATAATHRLADEAAVHDWLRGWLTEPGKDMGR
ncbi:MAG: trehalose-phosphatase [Kiloniellaceae bacterium]